MKKAILLFVILLLVFNCNTHKENYENQIGDTRFNPKLDNSNFKLCDSTNVLHKRALVTYKGGINALEKELIANYNFKPQYKAFSGYFIIRFVVNCNNESGRFRMETLNNDFKQIVFPKSLNQSILESLKALKNWNHAVYENKDYDSYKFITIKIINGKIQKS